MRRPPTGPPGSAFVPALIFINLIGALISSLGAPLIPEIASQNHVSLSSAQWSLTVTVLVSVIATPLMGRMSDGHRRRAVLLTALTVVAAGGIVAALAPDFPVLLLGRGMQGLGQGLTPVTIAAARSVLPQKRARSAVGMLSITNAAGVGLGYPLTGLVALGAGVRGAFWFGAVVAVLALAAAWKVVPAGEARTGVRTDWPGAALLALSLGAALLALSQGSVWGWASGSVLALFAAAVVAAAGWVVRELRTSQPLVDLRLLKIRTVLTADITVLLAGVGMYLLLSLTTRIAQAPQTAGGLGQSVVVSGLLLVPMSAASLLATVLSRRALRSVPLHRRLPLAAAVMLAAMLMFTAARSDIWILALTMAVAGIGIGLIFSVTPELIVAAVPPDETGSAMSFNQIFRYVGYSIGSALSATILQADTSPGAAFPAAQGYTTAGLIGCAMWVVTGLASVAAAGSRAAAAAPPASPEPSSTVKGKLP